MSKKGKGFNNPFADLKDKVRLPPPPPKAVARPAPPPSAAPPPVSDERLFEDEMAGVAPLEADPRGRLGAPEASPRPPVSRRVREEAESYAMLADLVEPPRPSPSPGGASKGGGVGAFDFTASEPPRPSPSPDGAMKGDEYIEGSAPGIDRRLLKRLRNGDYALEGHLDLHGLTSDEARPEVERFLLAARAAGKRCVLLIHGRGHHSKENIPVLKDRLKVWLTRGRIAQSVLAFATARPADGGAGALYVLLRRRDQPL